jgi:general L-amino acid transport system ATP-binding protein
VISLRRVEAWYGGHPVLRGVDLEVATGEVVVLCGPAGSGKSTLLRTVNRLEPFSGGEVLVDGHPVDSPGRSLAELRQEVGFVSQRPTLDPRRSLLDQVAAGPRWRQGKARGWAEAEALEVLDRVHLAEKYAQVPSQLTLGEQQRVAIARVLALRPRVLLFDDPTAALDPAQGGQVLEVMAGLARGGYTMLAVTHELDFARALADRMVLVDQGRIVEEAAPTTLLDRPANYRTRQFLRRLLDPGSGEVAAA